MSPARAAAHKPELGIALVVLMAACFATMDTTIKTIGVVVPVLVILCARYGVQAATMALWLLRSRRRPDGASFRAAHPRFQLVRGLLLLASSMFGFFGLQHLPLAEFTAINMLTPVIVTLLAGWLLHERISALRWALVGGGFVGALVVIRPGSGLFGWAVLLPIAGSVTYASFQVLTSRYAALESPYTTHFYTGLTGSLVIAALLIASPVDLLPAMRAAEPRHLGALLLIGALGTAGHLMLVVASGLAPASTLTPFLYAQIGFAALIGWLAFRDAPDGWGWLGIGVIAVSGAGSAWLNVREAAARALPVSALGVDSISD